MNNQEINYGILGDMSKEVNCNLFGDCSGSTVSRRTTKGFKQSFGLSDETISDVNAEHIIHAVMIVTLVALLSRKESAVLLGIILLVILIIFYLNGKK